MAVELPSGRAEIKKTHTLAIHAIPFYVYKCLKSTHMKKIGAMCAASAARERSSFALNIKMSDHLVSEQ